MRDVPTYAEKRTPSRAERLAQFKQRDSRGATPALWLALAILLIGFSAAALQARAPSYAAPPHGETSVAPPDDPE